MPYIIQPSEAKVKAQAILDERFSKFEAFAAKHSEFSSFNLLKPRIVWRAMGRNIAGRCFFSSKVIEMNTNYLSCPEAEEFIRSTLLHELAHSLAWTLFKDWGHGKCWKMMAKFIGDDGQRCCNYSMPTINKIEPKGNY